MKMWIVLETWPDAASVAICTHEDGTPKIFQNYAEAEAERADCQEGLILPIGGIGRRRLEAVAEIRRVEPSLDVCELWSLADLEKTCSDMRRIAKGVLVE